MTKQQLKAVVQAVEDARKSEFGVTGIKVEFEAKFGRMGQGENSCSDCGGAGRQQCGCCEGEGDHWCSDCDGEGRVDCSECDGTGEVETESDDDGNREMRDCEDCDGGGTVECDECNGAGRYDCDECDENGMVECEWCDGESEGGNPFVDTMYCHDWLFAKLAEVGLAERSDEGYLVRYEGNYGTTEDRYARNWKPKYPIAFSKVYYDGTVDTEWTITINLDKAKNILVLPKLIEAWNAMGAEINRICGTQTSVSNAGMHMAFLQTKDAVYPIQAANRQWKQAQKRKFENFRKSMTLLMPALYFLGSSNEHTRPLGYRRPKVGCQDEDASDHGTAINYTRGALEFRVFDTCYETPDAILDNVMVMQNALKYWRRTYKRNYLDTITKELTFGINTGTDLKRHYVTSQHIDLLNRGLKLLKPSYYSVRDVKRQRKFTVTKRETNNLAKKWREDAEIQYRQYEKRFGWEVALVRHNYIARYLERFSYSNSPDIPEPESGMSDIEQAAAAQAEAHRQSKVPLEEFCERKILEYNQRGVGEYSLTA